MTPPSSPDASWTYKVLHNFGFQNDGPQGVVIGRGGVFYGASAGGGQGLGSVFSLTPPASPGGVWTETVLYNFTGGTDGSQPNAVVIGPGGLLFGTTTNGGTGSSCFTGCGTVISLTP